MSMSSMVVSSRWLRTMHMSYFVCVSVCSAIRLGYYVYAFNLNVIRYYWRDNHLKNVSRAQLKICVLLPSMRMAQLIRQKWRWKKSSKQLVNVFVVRLECKSIRTCTPVTYQKKGIRKRKLMVKLCALNWNGWFGMMHNMDYYA